MSEGKEGPNLFTQIGEILFGGNMIAGTIKALAWFGAYAVGLTVLYRALKG